GSRAVPAETCDNTGCARAAPTANRNRRSHASPPHRQLMETMGPGFDWSQESWGRALRCAPLSAVAQHLFTTRQLQLRASNVSPATSPAAVEAGWAQAAASAGSTADALMRVKQVHGREVRVLKAGRVGPDAAAARPEADAVISNEPGLTLVVQVA